jgi:3-isopropylmalate dehydrogenase
VANPFGAILTAAMMLDHLGFADAAGRIERAVIAAIGADEVPAELGGTLGTSEVGDAVVRRLLAGS